MKSFFNIGKRKPKGIPDIVNPVFESTGILLTKTDKYGGGFKTLGKITVRWAKYGNLSINDNSTNILVLHGRTIHDLMNFGVNICGKQYFIKDVSPPIEVMDKP